MTKPCFMLLCLLLFLQAGAQLSGTLQVPSNYASVAAVITAINQQGVSGPLTVNISANHSETVPPGGFSLTATGSAANPIVFRKQGVGANPLLIAYAGGSGTPGSMRQDGVWRLIGCDHVTIDGIDIYDPNTANPATMEFGYGLFKVNGSDGCQNNTIQNCVITLNRINNAGGTGPAEDGSRGIDVVNASSGVHNSGVVVTSFSGSHSYNHFYGNTIRNCNIGISLSGFAGTSPFAFCDRGNDIGGSSAITGNSILDFGGGGSANACAGIKTLAQYDLHIGYNSVNNNTGSGTDHPALLRGIFTTAAPGANLSVTGNTLTLHGGASSSQLSVIENSAGAAGLSNTVTISDNYILNCSYVTSVSGPFYGIWNTASAANLLIHNNRFRNNSTAALSNSTYLVYNNGAVTSLISIAGNSLSFTYNGSSAYTGTMYSIYNANGTPLTTLSIRANNFSDYNHTGFAGTGSIYFIANTNDCFRTEFNENAWNSLFLHHSGAEYLIHNNSATQSLLSVCDNSIRGTFHRMAATGAMYLYYSSAQSPASCIQTYTGNIFSNITSPVAGTGIFYGIYSSDGASPPYPKKQISYNCISNISMNSTGAFYGYFCDNLGDGGSAAGSIVSNNTLSAVHRGGTIHGLYISGTVSPVYVPEVFANTIGNLNSSGASAAVYPLYLSGGGAGLHVYKNKISDILVSGATATAHGLYVNSAVSTTLSNNMIGNIQAPNSSAQNAVNGIYINAGTLVHVLYNTVCLNAVSSGGNFNSNALYCASTTSLSLRNTILVNLSSGGTGIAAAIRRSSTALTNYLASSNTNLLYAGVPGIQNVILQNGTTSYQTLPSFKTALAPRESGSVSQNPAFLSFNGNSPDYLHLAANMASPAESGATAIAGLRDDYDQQPRQGSTTYTGSGAAPDIGADEYEQDLTPCSSASAGSISPSVFSLCEGQSVRLNASGYTSGTGLLHQWKVTFTSGGPYAVVPGGSGASTPEYITQALPAGTYYFVMETTCGSVTARSAEATLTVYPVPTATAVASSTLVCSGQALYFTGISTGAQNYQWTGPGGFNTTMQNPGIAVSKAYASGIYYLTVSANNCTSAQASVAISVSELTMAIAASPSVLCAGNTATLSLNSSGTSYTWSTGHTSATLAITPVAGSVYSAVATNTANCSVSASIHVPVIQPSVTANNLVACGTIATVTLSVNAFSPSVVSWYSSPTTATTLGSGLNYSLTVFSDSTLYAEASYIAAGCYSGRIPVTVTLSPNPPVLVTAIPATVCAGGKCTLTATGATTYSWTGLGSGSSRTVSPLSQTVYTVTGKTSLGCTTTETLSVAIYSLPVVTAVQSATAVCPWSVVSFTASGASTYFWSSGANGALNTVTPAVNSTYTVYGSDSRGCSSSKTLSVVMKPVPAISILQSAETACAGATVTFSATGAMSYTWLPGNIVSATFTANPQMSAVYNAIGRSINTCTSVGIAAVSVEPCTGIPGRSFVGNLGILPNPSTGQITIISDSENYSLNIISSQGQIVYQTEEMGCRRPIDLSALAKGVYYVQLLDKNGQVFRKLLLQ